MPNTDIIEVVNFLNKYDTYFLVGHEDPDADSVSSLWALNSWLQRRNKKSYLCCKGSWDRTEIVQWEPLFHETIPKLSNGQSSALVVIDCAAIDRTGYALSDFPSGPILVLDHHPASGSFGDLRYINDTIPSATLIIHKIIEEAGDVPTKEEAEMIVLGFCTDTGFFRFLPAGRDGHLDTVGQLLKRGVCLGDIFQSLMGNKTFSSRKVLGEILARSELKFDGQMVVTWETWEDIKKFGTKRDADMLYQLLSGIKGVKVIAYIREKIQGVCTVGLRSNSDIDVRQIAAQYNGGGHIKASGCRIEGHWQDVMEQICSQFDELLSNQN